MKADNAILLAAGASSRFAPLSYEMHKALVEVHGEILIERQIRQLHEAGVRFIYVVTGYKSGQLAYLQDKFGVELIQNKEHSVRNNHASIWAARHVLGNSYICSVDNYFTRNPFEKEAEAAYYAAQYSVGKTKEWCMEEDDEGYINSVRIGGENAWYMMGHAFWSEEFSRRFLTILEREYDLPEIRGKLWESIFMEHLDVLRLRIGKYPPDTIFEFDTLEELRKFDPSYRKDTRSSVLKSIAGFLRVTEEEILNIQPIMEERGMEAIGFAFDCLGQRYRYLYEKKNLHDEHNMLISAVDGMECSSCRDIF